eukprot:268841_1
MKENGYIQTKHNAKLSQLVNQYLTTCIRMTKLMQHTIHKVYTNITEFYPDITNGNETIQICDGDLLFDKISNSYSVYIHHDCYYKIFTQSETASCFQNRRIWFLHESLGRNLYYSLISFIDDEYMNYVVDNTQVYSNDTLNLTLGFDGLTQVHPMRQFAGLSHFDEDGFLEFLENRIISNKYTEIVFGSLLHDIVRWNWYKEATPPVYYRLWIKALESISQIFMKNKIKNWRLYVWPGIMPSAHFGSKFSWVGYGTPIWLRTMLHALTDFMNTHPSLKQNIIFIDTVDVSVGHRNRMYSDDIHYGFLALRKHYPNASAIVGKMATNMVLNYLC